MKTRSWFAIVALLCSVGFAQQQWVTAYYTDWDTERMPPSEIDYTGLAAITYINIDPIGQPPYFRFHWPGRQRFEQVAAELIQRAHQAGVKVLLGLGGVWCEGDCGANAFLNHANDPAWVSNYANAVLSYARQQGYDGVSLDWEGSVFREGWIRLTDTLRAGLDRWTPRGLFGAAIAGYIPRQWNNPYDIAATNRNVDFIEVMSYDLNGWWRTSSGFNSPLYDPRQGWAGYDGDNVDSAMTVWLWRGLDRQKLAIGIPFYGFKWWGITGPVQTGWTNAYWTRYHFVLLDDLPYGEQFRDAFSRTPWIRKVTGIQGSNETAFVDYHDPQAVAEKARYAVQRQLGGIMVFDLNSGYLDRQRYPNVQDRNPLQTALRRALTDVREGDGVPAAFTLRCYPNPFNAEVIVEAVGVKKAAVEVYNLLGVRVMTGEVREGKTRLAFDAMASGVYFVRVVAGQRVQMAKVLMVK